MGPRLIDELIRPAARAPRPIEVTDALVRVVAPPPETVVADAPRFQRALDAARASGSAYGVTFAAVRDGQLLWTGSSGRDRGGRTELTPDTPLVIGSVTKTFVAATVLQLVEEGRVALEDPVRHHLPELSAVTSDITIAQLLDHTSGLADLFNDATKAALEEHPELAWTPDQVLGSLHAPWYKPGDGWAYANTNYYLLGMLVERVTGSSLAEELGRRFIGPLELGATRLLDGSEPGGLLAPAWTSIFWSSGAMTASAADLARWGDALYRGDILTDASRAAMLKLNSHDYGFGVQKVEVDGDAGYGHTGLLNTYTTLLYHLPAEGLTVALLVNRSHVDLGGMLTAEPKDGPSLLELALER
jgi:D-alanyl-D-alanine carboxypeptidase